MAGAGAHRAGWVPEGRIVEERYQLRILLLRVLLLFLSDPFAPVRYLRPLRIFYIPEHDRRREQMILDTTIFGFLLTFSGEKKRRTI
jgi:hypothetical protein